MFMRMMKTAWRALKKHWGRIAYYGGIAAVIAAVAFAADAYRRDEAELVLPAVDISEVVQAVQEEQQVLMPEGMTLLRGFGVIPEWNAHLAQWEAHTATDYALADGAVRCLCSGEVRTIGRSGIYGGFVEINCGEHMFRYASITPGVNLQVGETVDAGDVIGTADDGMPGEYDLGRHLHLEVYEGENVVNFEGLCAKTAF